jgi:hypothetical protein
VDEAVGHWTAIGAGREERTLDHHVNPSKPHVFVMFVAERLKFPAGLRDRHFASLTF